MTKFLVKTQLMEARSFCMERMRGIFDDEAKKKGEVWKVMKLEDQEENRGSDKDNGYFVATKDAGG